MKEKTIFAFSFETFLAKEDDDELNFRLVQVLSAVISTSRIESAGS